MFCLLFVKFKICIFLLYIFVIKTPLDAVKAPQLILIDHCFTVDCLFQENFNVDEFVLECRRRVQLEDLRDDLSVYLKILRSAMIELINKDYADFVNLSSNLVSWTFEAI